MALSDAQIERYSRQIILPGVGGRGQEALLRASVLIAGMGEVARTASLYLAGAGVGRLTLSAFERSEETAADLRDLNPEVDVAIAGLPDSSAALLSHDAVLALAMSETHLAAIARAARGRFLVTAGATSGSGWLTISGRDGLAPCPICAAYAESEAAAPSDASATASVIGSLAALEVLRRLLGIGEAGSRWLHYDGRAVTLEERTPAPRAGCGLCAGRSE